jgi:hypothetical protein
MYYAIVVVSSLIITALCLGAYLTYRLVQVLVATNAEMGARVERISQLAITYKASCDVHPTLGPALLQKLPKLGGISQEKKEKINEVSPALVETITGGKGGVTLRTGVGAL